MQLPIKAHYATVAMLALASRYELDEPVQARVIATNHGVPSQFLGQILQQLRNAGLVTSLRGSNGGFRLAKPPEQISIIAILEAVCATNAAEQFIDASDPIQHTVRTVWQESNALQLNFFGRTTLANLVENLAPEPAMFFI